MFGRFPAGISCFACCSYRESLRNIESCLRGNIPEFIHITDAATHEVNILDILVPVAGAFYLIDRGYLDFQRLHDLDRAGAFFVTRAKKRFNFRRRYSHPVDRSAGFICDQTILLTGYYPAKKYPKPLRRIRYRDTETKETLVFLTNNFDLDTPTIAQLYKARWQVELFFKWIKQHLRIKAFYGTSANAVKMQIWIAVCAYLLACCHHEKEASYRSNSLHNSTGSERLAFRKNPIMELFAKPMSTLESIESQKQLYLFDF